MKVSMSEAARLAGIKSRSTFYRHIEKKGISVDRSDPQNPVVDVAELIRVYGDKIKPNTDEQGRGVQNNTPHQTPSNRQSREDVIPLSAMNKIQEQIEDIYKERIEDLKSQLELQTKQNTILLEDRSKKDEQGREWEKSLRALEARISNQETTAKEDKERADKILRQNRALKKALDEEKNKSFFKKLFG